MYSNNQFLRRITPIFLFKKVSNEQVYAKVGKCEVGDCLLHVFIQPESCNVYTLDLPILNKNELEIHIQCDPQQLRISSLTIGQF